MGKLRFLLALWLASCRSGAEDHPAQRYGLSGSLALKLCPDFLRYVGKPGTIIAVTGTNGKTPSAIC